MGALHDSLLHFLKTHKLLWEDCDPELLWERGLFEELCNFCSNHWCRSFYKFKDIFSNCCHEIFAHETLPNMRVILSVLACIFDRNYFPKTCRVCSPRACNSKTLVYHEPCRPARYALRKLFRWIFVSNADAILHVTFRALAGKWFWRQKKVHVVIVWLMVSHVFWMGG